MPVGALGYAQMVVTARRHPARTEGAADIGVPPRPNIKLPQPPRADPDRLHHLQHQDIGAGGFGKIDWIHRTGKQTLMIFIRKATQIQGQSQQHNTPGKHQKIQCRQTHIQGILKIAHYQDH